MVRVKKFDWSTLPVLETTSKGFWQIRAETAEDNLRKAQAHIRYLEEKILSLIHDVGK